MVFTHNLVAKSHACNARVPYSSLNGVCVCVVRVKVQIVFFWGGVHVKLVLPKYQATPSYAKNSS